MSFIFIVSPCKSSPGLSRDVFDIHSGDSLVILGDEEQGMAVIKASAIMNMMNNLVICFAVVKLI